VPVLIAGGGPVGLTLAALLARHGIASRVIEADPGYCTGSRAICISRRSQEIQAWVGADKAVVATGLPGPEALLQGPHGGLHLTQCFGKDFVCLVFGDGALTRAMTELAEHGVGVLDIPPEADSLGQARQRYGLPGAQVQGLVLVRPDGYVMGRWRGLDPAALLAALKEKGIAS
jgi:phytoene dehydrogenase-like protein